MHQGVTTTEQSMLHVTSDHAVFNSIMEIMRTVSYSMSIIAIKPSISVSYCMSIIANDICIIQHEYHSNPNDICNTIQNVLSNSVLCEKGYIFRVLAKDLM